jgi:hypothetical protein
MYFGAAHCFLAFFWMWRAAQKAVPERSDRDPKRHLQQDRESGSAAK